MVIRTHPELHLYRAPVGPPPSGRRHDGGSNPLSPEPTSALKLTYQNIRGWETNRDVLRETLIKGCPDVILLTETGMPDSKKIWISPYVPYQRNTKSNEDSDVNEDTRWSGAAILINKSIQHRRVEHEFLHDTVAVVVETLTGPVIVATNYHPPSRNYLPAEDLDWLASHNLPVYLLADLNAHHRTFPYHGTEKKKGKVLHDWWIKNGKLIRQGPDFPTVTHPRSLGTAPDIVLTNSRIYHNHHIKRLSHSTISDHSPIGMTISTKPILKKIHCEDIDNADWISFTAQLKDTSSVINLRNSDCGGVVENLKKIVSDVNEAKSAHIPMIKIRHRPFIAASAKFNRFLKILNKLNIIYNSTKDPWVRLHTRLQKAKITDLLREEGRICARLHWESVVERVATLRTKEPKKYWAALKRLRGGSRKSIQITNNHSKTGRRLFKNAEIEEGMREVWPGKFVPPPARNYA